MFQVDRKFISVEAHFQLNVVNVVMLAIRIRLKMSKDLENLEIGISSPGVVFNA